MCHHCTRNNIIVADSCQQYLNEEISEMALCNDVILSMEIEDLAACLAERTPYELGQIIKLLVDHKVIDLDVTVSFNSER